MTSIGQWNIIVYEIILKYTQSQTKTLALHTRKFNFKISSKILM